jgi:hypothetical protein
MATTVITPNVYRINNSDITVARFGFPVSSVIFREVSGVVTTAAGVRLYGIVELKKQGLEVLSQPQYYTVETVAQLAALANA